MLNVRDSKTQILNLKQSRNSEINIKYLQNNPITISNNNISSFAGQIDAQERDRARNYSNPLKIIEDKKEELMSIQTICYNNQAFPYSASKMVDKRNSSFKINEKISLQNKPFLNSSYYCGKISNQYYPNMIAKKIIKNESANSRYPLLPNSSSYKTSQIVNHVKEVHDERIRRRLVNKNLSACNKQTPACKISKKNEF